MSVSDPRIADIRRFNRFFTRTIGALQQGLLGGPFSLTETRVLYEIGHGEGLTAAELARTLELDTGYLSRILGRFTTGGILDRATSRIDTRKSELRLTALGRDHLATEEARADAEIGVLLGQMPHAAGDAMVAAMAEIERALSPAAAEWQLRGVRPGDIGWVISRHGSIYAAEYGWDGTFEFLVAEIAAGIMRKFDPASDGAWIAEIGGVPVGSVFLVRVDAQTAKLRLLILDAAARGRGIGRALVGECILFARAAGYRRIALWTMSMLEPARRIYAEAGFRLTESAAVHQFGVDLVEETWVLDLDGGVLG
jgi:DNA-binding MarR family transcriptional regulator